MIDRLISDLIDQLPLQFILQDETIEFIAQKLDYVLPEDAQDRSAVIKDVVDSESMQSNERKEVLKHIVNALEAKDEYDYIETVNYDESEDDKNEVVNEDIES